MVPEINMRSAQRKRLLDMHDFFVKQVKARVLRNFDNIEEEALRLSVEVYNQAQAGYSEDGDMGAAADETAVNHGVKFYHLLTNLKIQTSLGALASLYHQWEKDFREFMASKLSLNNNDRAKKRKSVWDTDINDLFNDLVESGWSIRQAQWFPVLKACRVIVNVHKHGQGSALCDLARHYPQYLKFPNDDIPEVRSFFLPHAGHGDLAITEKEFDEIAGALRQFWMDFP